MIATILLLLQTTSHDLFIRAYVAAFFKFKRIVLRLY